MATKIYLAAAVVLLGAGLVAPVIAQTEGTTEAPPAEAPADEAPGMGMEMGGMAGHGPMFDFAAIDADKDGKVTKDELMAYRQSGVAGTDADGDGLISVEELAAHMKAQMAARIDERAKARVEAQDANGDGKLSAEELVARPMPMRMFDRLDADGDGAVSEEELAKAREMMRERMGGRGDGRGDDHRKGHNGKGWFMQDDDN
ncbi:MAG TPA: EF-hand domain-containing protein [Albidovulum sp.]|uniref:EF-hand domain-containing protein n=1 Tax=Albidovulum sp. TaxID=1872424 RepID=UPI002CA4AA76|nr:EF-hand domain-containing protein [Albidovulum sp.]